MLKLIRNSRFWMAVFVAVVAVLAFFDCRDMERRTQIDEKIRELEVQKKYYQERIEEDSTTLYRILNDDAFLEKYARDHHLMKRDRDVVFIILPDSVSEVK